MTAQAGAVAACPFCGSERIVTLHEDTHNIAAVCNAGAGGCGARGPYARSVSEAIAAWNRRTPAAVPVEALEGLVAGLNDSIAHNDESEDWLRGAKTTAAFIRDELTTIIKERSNG